MSIDWSKSPEGATHWDPVDNNWLRQFSGTCLGWINCAGWSIKGWQYPHNLSEMDRLIQRPPDQPWSGEGEPPVGVRIEAKHKNAQADWARPGFYETEIVAIGKQLMIFEADGSGHEKVGKLADYIFRPIRTPEQISAEERKIGVDAIRSAVSKSPNCKAHGLDWDVACAIYDAGWRKVTP